MKICPRCLKQHEDAVTYCPDDGTELRPFKESAARVTGKVLDGRWLIERKIAEGGMGEVYAGQQVSMNRQVAIKVLRPAMASNEEYVNRFFREANIASTIKHPNFVHIYDFGQEQELGILYLAMEYLEGIDLADRIVQGKMPLDQVLEIGVQVCSALAAAHAANIVHRDLKPENIFLTVSPGAALNVKVLDFGIAKELGASTSVTRTGQIFGTPEYMSPEQCQNFSAIDGRSDLYSVGCVLYELLTGRSPFGRETVIATLLAQVQEKLVDIRVVNPSIPDSTAAIVHRLLQKKPDNRFVDAVQAREALEQELMRVRTQPDELTLYLETHASTEEFDRQVTNWAVQGNQSRKTSQFIDLNDIIEQHDLDEVVPVQPRTRSKLPLILALIVVSGALVLAGWKFQSKPPTPPPPDPAPAFATSSDAFEHAIQGAISEAHSESARTEADMVARQFAILATSIALTTEVPRATPTRTQKKPRDTNPLLNIRTTSGVDKRAANLSKHLEKCFALRPDIHANGEFKFQFRILPDGSVDSVTVKAANPDSPEIRTCIQSTIGRWTFPASNEGSGINYHERTVRFAFGGK